MQYTLRNIPRRLDKALRAKAKAEGKSINTIAVEALEAAMGVNGQPVVRRDLSGIVGTWVEDPAFDAVIREHDQVDPEMWK